MTDQDYIRKAVELADDVWPWDYHKKKSAPEFSGHHRDALAAQLVRQVDRQGYTVLCSAVSTAISESDGEQIHMLVNRKRSGRTMNTIKAIVDSKVLE